MSKVGVAVTGIGPVSSVGTGHEEFWSSLLRGDSGTRPLTRMPGLARGCHVVSDVVNPAFTPLNPARPIGRAVELAQVAAELAIRDAGLDPASDRVGIIVGSSIGNADVIESVVEAVQKGSFISPGAAFNGFTHAAACEIARQHNVRGPIQSVSSGCNSGADAIGMAADWIRLGRADAVIVGGTENELSTIFMHSMQACKALATRHNQRPAGASRPFDPKRDGNIPGEGAGFLVLESADRAAARGARVRALLSSYASSAVGARQYDPFNPDLNPAHMVRNLDLAIRLAGLTRAEISCVSANGSSSVLYDVMESKALAEITGPMATTVPVYSVKGAIGQTGACTSALQVIAAILTAQHRTVPPTVNNSELDPQCAPINLIREATPAPELRHVLCNAIGFGGFYYSAVVISAPTSEKEVA